MASSLDHASAWLTLLTAGAAMAKVPLPPYLAVPAACIGVASALETIAPGFWERFATGNAGDDEDLAREYAAQETASWLASFGEEKRPTDRQIVDKFRRALYEWRQLHASNLDLR